VSNPSPNYDGSARKGANLFTKSIVALDMGTGKLKWHYQAIHHDIWDWDLMTGPTLFDVTVKRETAREGHDDKFCGGNTAHVSGWRQAVRRRRVGQHGGRAWTTVAR